LRDAGQLSLDEFDATRHGDLLVRLFEGLEGVKSSAAQVVFASKTLHHLLPELIVPFDNQITCGFFGWRMLPNRASAEWLCGIYSILGDVASEVGPKTLDALGEPYWPLDPAVSRAFRIGRARVVDLGMEGYRRSAAEDWYVA
jgi:hypothetical protein